MSRRQRLLQNGIHQKKPFHTEFTASDLKPSLWESKRFRNPCDTSPDAATTLKNSTHDRILEMTYYYDGLREIYAQIVSTQKKKSNLKTPSSLIGEDYYGRRRTASGTLRDRDEPDDATQLRQSDQIRRNQLQRTAKAGRDALRAKGKIPTKGGVKTFEQFMEDANADPQSKQDKANAETLKQFYLAARSLDYNKFMIFVNEIL
jgi:hypothetical protein